MNICSLRANKINLTDIITIRGITVVKKSLIEQISDEREAERWEEERRYILKEKMEVWEKNGFIITPLNKVINGDLKTAETEFELYEGALMKLKELNKLLSTMDIRGFEYEVQIIQPKLNDPRYITELEKDVANLKEKIDTRRIEEEKRQKEIAEIEYKKFAEERRKLELEAQRRESEIKILELEKQKKEQEKKRLKAEAKKIKEERKKVKAQAKKAEQEAKKMKMETKRKEKEKRKAELDLEAKKLEKEMKKLEVEVNKRDEEQKKLMVKKKEEEDRIVKIKQVAIEQWEKEYALKATSYISNVDAMMRVNKPEYSPLGYYLKDNDWKVELNPVKSEVIGKISEKLIKEQLRIVCVYHKEFEKQFISNSKQLILGDASAASKSKKFISKCYVLDKLDDKNVISTLEAFKHPYCSVYIYNLEDNRLIYNKNDMKTEFFSEWFKIKGEPRNMKEILIDISDKEEVFTVRDLREKLNFGKKEMEAMLKSYEERNLVYRLIGEKDKYTFVRGK